MKTIRKNTGWGLVMGIMLATSVFAQGLRKQGNDQQQRWLKFEKELGLQTCYSVDMEMQAMGMTMASKMFRTEGKMRSETTLPMLNLRLVALELTENGKQVHYSLFPDKKKYCIDTNPDEADDATKKPAYKLEDLGTEAYEGVTCKKRRMTLSLPDGGSQVMDMLFSPKQKNMPVKMTATSTMKPEPDQAPMTITSVVLFKNYLFATPDHSLFVIPKDYTQAKDMAEIMMGGGGMFGLPQAGGNPQPAGGATLPPEALEAIRQAQADAAKEAAKENVKEEATKEATGEGVRQGLQGLRNLLGR